MGPKSTPVKPANTLFSYFTKSPSANKSLTPNSKNPDVLSPKKSPNQDRGKPTSGSSTPGSKQTNHSADEFVPGDLLWSKLEGYPWWPSLVCNHPTENTHFKGVYKNPQVHVQFFDDPVSRAWIKTKNVRPFKGATDKEFMSHKPAVKKGAEEAEKAKKLSREERLNLVVELQPSDDEDLQEEEESMDFDPDIFDDEMEDETDNSKENVSITETSEDKTEKKKGKSPKKSPRKNTRKSARTPKPKRRRIMEHLNSDEESGDEFKLDSDEESGHEDDDDVSSGVEESSDDSEFPESEPDASPVKEVTRKRKRPAPVNFKPKNEVPSSSSPPPQLKSFVSEKKPAFTPTVGEKTKSRLAAFTASDAPSTPSQGTTEQEANFPHLKFEFLHSSKIKDMKGRLKSDPEYDPRNLYIPESFKKTLTPALRQWWELKANYFDTILFFKMGKFYELFHMDAVVCVNELGLIYMKGEHAHCGFPEIAYNRYADTLIQKGYKVARIEQTETPDMMTERLKKSSKAPTKFDKVVKREICRVTGKGTQTFSFLDGDCSEAKSSYLLAVAEKEEGGEGCSTYGVCFVDTSIGKFHIGQFADDRHCSRLRTLLAHYTPVQILFEKNKMSLKTQQVLKNNLTSVMKEALSSGSEFWESSKTLKLLAEEDYFKDESGEFSWPDTIKKMISDADSLGLSAADSYNLAIRSLGALTWYLQYSLLDQELLSMKTFEEYSPLDDMETKKSGENLFSGRQHMVLDGVTLANLDITQNSSTGTSEGTLLEQLDACSTHFGRRLFRQWLCAPLCNPVAINDRLDAVEDLIGSQDLVATTKEVFKKLPDLERLLNRIHSLGSASKSKNHPDSRAIMFDEAKYSKKKIEDFLLTIDGFKSSYKVVKKFQDQVKDFKSTLLKKTLTIGSDGHFPDLHDDIEFFEHSFDHNKARKDGVIVPNKGVDPDYDQAVLDIKSIERKLDEFLERQRTRLGCRSMVYWGTAKNRYQMEIPESALKRVPDEYELMSSKKGWKRYRTREIDNLFGDLCEAEDEKDAALKDTMRRIFHSFDERYRKWDAALQCISVLDVLFSLSVYSRCGDGAMCRPEIVLPEDDQQPFMEIRDGRHPCISNTFSGGDFIPNDTVIGTADENEMDVGDGHDDSRIILLTGPNMGGKSTLMRQVGLITIMAQMGCYVPADKCRLTPVDRVFTRLGASDRIMAGESTFFVELSETSAILQHATRHSLVLMDELGRGTATYDGTAIACAVVEELSRKVYCRTLFSTHYHSLVEEFSHDPNIRLGHMACMVENEDESDPTQETITFLYKMSGGACPKSYGFNAAKLANIPADVIKVAVMKAKQFEEMTDNLRITRALMQTDCSHEKLKSLQQQIRYG